MFYLSVSLFPINVKMAKLNTQIKQKNLKQLKMAAF